MKLLSWLKRKWRTLSQVTIASVIILVSLILGYLLILNQPNVPKELPAPLAPLVEVVEVEPEEKQVVIEAYGTIQGNRQVTLHPEVSGRVIEQSKNLVVGGLVKKDEVLLKIDPRDYLTAVEQEKAAVKRAEFELKLEQGRRVVAEREWELLGPSIEGSEVGRELALRLPQLQDKRASLDAAKSRLEKVKLDYERTVLYAPFDAIVTQEFTEVGQLITPQMAVATLVATSEFRVQVSLPYEQLKWIGLPDPGQQEGSAVLIVQELGSEDEISRSGTILRLLGDVDLSGRMTRLLVKIPDPLDLESSGRARQPFLIGSYVRVDFYGPLLEDVFVLSRTAVHEGNVVFVRDKEGKLEIRPVKIIFGQKESVVISEGLQAGDEVVISALPVVIPGMELRKEE